MKDSMLILLVRANEAAMKLSQVATEPELRDAARRFGAETMEGIARLRRQESEPEVLS